MTEKKSLFKQILTWTVVGIVAVLAVKLALGLLGAAFGVVGFLLFTVGPILLVGWLAMKGWEAFSKKPNEA
jgi:ABC-type sugar transport system permease subunit